MIPKRIILVRHGRSMANDDPSLYSRIPDYRIELTEEGKNQACKVGEKIAGLVGNESYGIYVSPYVRTLQTKDCIVGKMGHAPVFDYQDPCLREQDCGNLPGVLEVKANREARGQYGAFFYRFPDGESCADVHDRMIDFLSSLRRLFDKDACPDNILVVTHSVALRCFLFRWYRWTIDYFDALPSLPNCHLALLSRIDNGQYELSEPFAESPCFGKWPRDDAGGAGPLD